MLIHTKQVLYQLNNKYDFRFSLFPVAMINTITKKILGGKGFLSTYNLLSFIGTRRKKLKQNHTESLPTSLLSTTCSTCFLIPPRTTCTRMALPTVRWPLPCQPLIKKLPHRLAYRQPEEGNLSIKFPSFR